MASLARLLLIQCALAVPATHRTMELSANAQHPDSGPVFFANFLILVAKRALQLTVIAKVASSFTMPRFCTTKK